MRTMFGSFPSVPAMASTIVFAAMASIALAAPEISAPDSSHSPATPKKYYLRGYYKIDSQRPVWQDSDSAPWVEAKADSAWTNRRIVNWGYVPFTHEANNFYCLIDKRPRTGSHIEDVTFVCGDPAIVESLFLQNDWKPNIPMIGGGPPLENSLRSAPPGG